MWSVSQVIFLNYREFYLFDLVFGGQSDSEVTSELKKIPTLLSYFPFYLYSNNINKIFSIDGSRKSIFFQNVPNTEKKNYFVNNPNIFLNSKSFYSWISSNFMIPLDIPQYSYMFILKYDLISNEFLENFWIDSEFKIFEMKFRNTHDPIDLQLLARFELEYNNDNDTESINGFLHYTLVFKKESEILKTQKDSFTIISPKQSKENKKIFNNFKKNHPFFTQRLKQFKFQQILSPQNIIIKVNE